MSGRKHRESLDAKAEAAFRRGDLEESIRLLGQVAASLRPEDDDAAPEVYENLGFTCLYSNRPVAAIRALLRALDGNLASRETSLRLLVLACLEAERGLDAMAALEVYEQTFGAHPDGMTSRQLQTMDIEARKRDAGARPV